MIGSPIVTCDVQCERIAELEAENAKLRELVAIFRSKEDIHPCINAQCLKCNDAELCEREAELVCELGVTDD